MAFDQKKDDKKDGRGSSLSKSYSDYIEMLRGEYDHSIYSNLLLDGDLLKQVDFQEWYKVLKGVDVVAPVTIAFTVKPNDEWLQCNQICEQAMIANRINLKRVRLITAFNYKDIEFDYDRFNYNMEVVFNMVKKFNKQIKNFNTVQHYADQWYQQVLNDMFTNNINVTAVDQKVVFNRTKIW